MTIEILWEKAGTGRSRFGVWAVAWCGPNKIGQSCHRNKKILMPKIKKEGLLQLSKFAIFELRRGGDDLRHGRKLRFRHRILPVCDTSGIRYFRYPILPVSDTSGILWTPMNTEPLCFFFLMQWNNNNKNLDVVLDLKNKGPWFASLPRLRDLPEWIFACLSYRRFISLRIAESDEKTN